MPQLPPIFIERLKAIIPPELFDDALARFSIPRPAVYRINTLKISADQIYSALDSQGIAYQKIAAIENAISVDRSIASVDDWQQKGVLYKQGLSSQLVVKALDPQANENILDLCAAPGSKTTQISALMKNSGAIVAVEHIRSRLYKLRSVVELLGAANVSIKFTDARKFKSPQLFDRILVDAPCSSEGRFDTMNAKSIGYWSPRKIKEMAHKQKGILNAAGRLLKPGGTLVYSTCTFAPEENEEAVDWFLRKNKGAFDAAPIDLPGVPRLHAILNWEGQEMDLQLCHCLRIRPSEWNEGFFIAKIIKR